MSSEEVKSTNQVEEKKEKKSKKEKKTKAEPTEDKTEQKHEEKEEKPSASEKQPEKTHEKDGGKLEKSESKSSQDSKEKASAEDKPVRRPTIVRTQSKAQSFFFAVLPEFVPGSEKKTLEKETSKGSPFITMKSFFSCIFPFALDER
jgi:hypothetical protein